MERRLLSKVAEHRLIYALDDVHYRDRHMRAMAWSDIGKELNISAAQCKDMWRKLRNCYLNAINRRQTKNIPKWRYEDEMSFLLPFIDVKASDNGDLEGHQQSPSLSPCTDGPVDHSEDSSEMILPETSTFVTKMEADLGEPMDGAIMRRGRGFSMQGRDYTPQGRYVEMSRRDETELFFLSISETVRRLPAVDQARIKMELGKMVYEAEIKQLQEYETGM